MKRVLALLAVVGLVAGMTGVANAQVVLIGGAVNNGDFDETEATLIIDNPDPPPPNDVFAPKPTVWINEGTRAITGPYEDELSSEPWAGPAPTPVTTRGNGAPSPDGCNGLDCGVFFKPFGGNTANGAATAHLYQDLPATPGLKYILKGWAGAEPNFLADAAEFGIEFLDGVGDVIGGDIQNIYASLFVDNGLPFDYKEYMAMAWAPEGTAEVRARVSMLGGIPNPAGGGQAFVVDDFTLTCVPEPASFALVGLAAVGLVAFRRRK